MNKKDPFSAPNRLYPDKKAPEVVEETEGLNENTLVVPSGTLKDVKTWVSNDVERAVLALEKEENSEHPRSTLVSYLRDLLGEY